MHNVRPQEHGFFLQAIPKKLFAGRPSLTLKPLAKALSISRLRTISFLALAEETAAAFGCCYLFTPRALHLRGCQASRSRHQPWLEGTSTLWELRSRPVSSCQTTRLAAGATVSILIPFPSGGLGAKRRKTGFAKRRRAPGFSRLQRKQEKKVMLLFRCDEAYCL